MSDSDSKYTIYCEQLYKAMKGAGTYEDTLIKITASEPLKERLKIKDKYIVIYGLKLLDDL